MSRIFIALLCVLNISYALAGVRLPKIFSSHMVLQRDKPITIWGWADPKEKVTISFHDQSASAVAGKDGQWKVVLKAEAAGGPYRLQVKGKEAIVLDDILVGDVWVCSGQSNMEWSLSVSNNPSEEISNANYPGIRHFKVPNTVATDPKADIVSGEWQVCTPQNAANFTAVGYFFARELSRELNVPIGLINSSWGGTHVETWTSRSAFEQTPEFKEMISKMPRFNLDSLAKKNYDDTMTKLKAMQPGLPYERSETGKWAAPGYDDKAWRKMQIPDLWENQELGQIDGVVWVRKTFNLTAAEAGKAATLGVGMIDDSDETYVNGTKVGSTIQRYNEKRVYQVAPGILKEGANVIAVRIEDTGGGGGIYGDASFLYLKIDNNTIPLAGQWSYQMESVSNVGSSVGPNSYPTLLFNAMIHPILPLGIKGVIWYQGESNAGRAYEYRKSFPLMITDWRKQWKQGDFPFYFVQLASFRADNGNSERGSGWAELREAQALTRTLPNTGMAVTVDIGDPNDIHPRNKQDVGKRLAALALNRTYSKKTMDSGPQYESMKIEGNKAIITLKNEGSGLMVPDRYGYVKGFEIAGEDKKFRYARAYISGNTVVVSHDNVTTPVAVRYGWADDASDCNLFNREGFPAEPFRTDTWKGITEGARFSFQ